mmetsp:Transcript_29899/g.86951  ORF Transcript_29899/g.86951 Transcript_29899/m.86951 type:complete len:215 (-) Transcript_29899:2123-2767(-)
MRESLQLLDHPPVPRPLVHNGRLHNHLAREERREDGADNGRYEGFRSLVGDQPTCHQLFLVADVLDRRPADAEGFQECIQDLHCSGAHCVVAEDVHLGTTGSQERLDATDDANYDGEHKQYEHKDLAQEQDRPKAQVTVLAPPYTSSARPPARPQSLAHCSRTVVGQLALARGVRTAEIARGPKSIKQRAEGHANEKDEVRHPSGLVQAGDLVK